MKRVLVVFGTRPEAIKLAPVIHRLRQQPDLVNLTVCSTGQHRQMLDSTMEAFDLQTDCDLDVMTDGQHPTDLLGRLLLELRGVLDEVKPDVVIVQGDTTTVMASALAGFAARAKVAHVEAGLRTRNKHAPFPEEINRRVAGVVADYHFVPTTKAKQNLLDEGVDENTITLTGNTVIDALYWMRDRVAGKPLPPELDPGRNRLVLVTAHRRESFGEPFRQLCLALRDLAERYNDVSLIYPVHLNPRVRKPVYDILGGCERIKLVEPLTPAVFVALLSRAYLVLTDSGGIQEEAPALGKPVLVLRDVTERPEAVAAGVVKLVGTDRTRIVDEASCLLSDPDAHAAMARETSVYGDGLAAARIAEVILHGRMTTPPFEPATVLTNQ
jgi:UDP-N-acetylglucosamine 2-epimerase